MSDALLADVHYMVAGSASDTPLDLEMVIRVMDDLWYRALCMPEQVDGATR